jgi:TRAP-type C4-dicarboxylate transport system permease small subunit
VVDWTVVGIGAVMIVLVFANVVLHVFGKDMAVVTELAELLMVWVTFLSGACAARRGAQMTITEFVDMLGGKTREKADAAIDLLEIVMLALLFWYGINLVVVGWGNELTVLQIPMSFQYLGMPVGVAAIMIWILYDLWLILQGKTRTQRWPKD